MKANSQAELACMTYAEHSEMIRQLGLEIGEEVCCSQWCHDERGRPVRSKPVL